MNLKTRYRQLITQELVAIAVQKHLPVKQDHCFARIILDNLFHDVWYRHVKAPAINHLTPEQLRQAIKIGESLKDPRTCARLNRLSQMYRLRYREQQQQRPQVKPGQLLLF